MISTLKRQINVAVQTALKQVGSMGTELPCLEFPPEIQLGDFCLPCFKLSKELRQSPTVISATLAETITSHDYKLFEEVKAVGPYLNFKINRQYLFEFIINDVNTSFGDELYNRNPLTVMIEYLSPNTNKPLHLGHVRNGTLGMAVANILEEAGNQVIKANLVNDRGVHICKSMLAWLKWGNGITPGLSYKKGDHLVGDFYVMFENKLKKQSQIIIAKKTEEIEVATQAPIKDAVLAQITEEAKKEAPLTKEVQEMLLLWESGDEAILNIWRIMNQWAYDGFGETYNRYGFHFDKIYYESNTYKLGKDIVQRGIESGLFFGDDKGMIVAELPVEIFGKNDKLEARRTTVLREDGTSVYMTQDLGTACLKFDDFKLDRSVYVVASEQNDHFKNLFYLLGELGFSWASGCHHLSYGMVYLPHGRMKSREGTVIDADNLLNEMTNMALQEIMQRLEIQSETEELRNRAEKIALSAIKFFLLRVTSKLDIHFDPESSLSFDGCTGPYCLYAYARANTLLAKSQAGDLPLSSIDYSTLGNDDERLLIQKIGDYPEQVKFAAEEMNPNRIATYTYELAKLFNQFYEKNPILTNEDKVLSSARLTLVWAAKNTLKQALALLGIETIENM